MTVNVAINGFGRIGRLVFRRILEYKNEIRAVVINDLEEGATLAHLLKHDTTHGKLREAKFHDHLRMIFSSNEPGSGVYSEVISVKDLSKLPWGGENDIGVVVESTGAFIKRGDLEKHLQAGAKKVVLTAPAKTGEDVDLTVVMGVNENKYDPARHHLISNASCTTNCLAPVAKVLNDNLGIVKGWVSTVHAYTNDQRLLDLPHKDLRRARAAAENFLPASTGAAKAIGLVIPELEGKLQGAAWRVPVPDVSAIDFIIEVIKKTDAKEVNAMLWAAAARSSVLSYTDEELVSSDFIGNPYSAIVDAKCTAVIGGNMVRVVAWYDNEWAYSCRVVDLIERIAKEL